MEYEDDGARAGGRPVRAARKIPEGVYSVLAEETIGNVAGLPDVRKSGISPVFDPLKRPRP